MILSLPRLFKKTSTGAIQFWEIFVSQDGDIGVISTLYGQLGTDRPQSTREVIREGKNAGKKNATTPVEQAMAEARSQWEKKKKKGYVEKITQAQDGHVDEETIEGGIFPMLAEKYADQGHKIVFPCLGQPKLDGARCIAVVDRGKVSLWTRTRKPIRSVPHIVNALERSFPNETVVFDGELYNHALKSDFERLMSLVRKDEPGEGHTDVQYHIYDLADPDAPTLARIERLADLATSFSGPLIQVLSRFLDDEGSVFDFFQRCRADGYEGAMVRNLDAPYAYRRSPHLQKVKEFDDAEFPIVGVEEGRGRLAGHAGSFVCKTETGATFNAKLKGSLARLKELFKRPDLWQGQSLVVQFQGRTADGIPRFPIGIRFRDSQDF